MSMTFDCVLKNARSIMIDDTVYYDLYDLGYSFGYKRWDGKSYNDNGEKIELPYKSKINNLAKDTGVDLGSDISKITDYKLSSLSSYSCREILGFVAGVLGCNAIIDRNGNFKFNTCKYRRRWIFSRKRWKHVIKSSCNRFLHTFWSN